MLTSHKYLKTNKKMYQNKEINDFCSKCRCCLKNISQNEQSIIIDSIVHQQFYDLTQISVRIDEFTKLNIK